MNDCKFIGIVSKEDIIKTLGTVAWEPIPLVTIPFPVITPSPGYMLTMGSGNLSMPTLSIYGISQIAGIDILRHDFTSHNSDEPFVNIDHYIAGSVSPYRFAVYQTPPTDYHWPKLTDPIIGELPSEWRYTVKGLINGSK